MERFNALGRGTQMMLVSSVLLLIISFFNWQEVEFDLGPLGSGSAGVSAWDDFLGIVMGLLAIVLIARIVARVAAVEIPIPVSYAVTSGVLAFLIFACALIKNLTDDYSTWASYVGVVLAFLIAAGAWMEIQTAGGMEHVKSQMPSSSGTTAPEATAAAPAAAAPAPSAPAAPAAEESADNAEAAADAGPEATDTDTPSTERET